MLKKTIKYTDYNGNTRTEDFYFNLSKSELAMMDLSEEGGLQANLEPLLNKMDVPKLAKFFERMILTSYGEKSPDGKRFIKTPEMAEAFHQTEAYSELFMELMASENGANAAADFLANILPPDMQAEARKAAKQVQENGPRLITE